MLGEDYFYRSNDPMLKRAYGMIYLKDMDYQESVVLIVSIKELLDARATMRIV